MKVHFNYPDEFIQELSRDGPPSGIVRLTRSYRPTAIAFLKTLVVLAAYANARGEIVELEHFCGEVCRDGDESVRRRDRPRGAGDRTGRSGRAGSRARGPPGPAGGRPDMIDLTVIVRCTRCGRGLPPDRLIWTETTAGDGVLVKMTVGILRGWRRIDDSDYCPDCLRAEPESSTPPALRLEE